MTNQEKVEKVIDLYNQGIDVEEIAAQVGYSHPKSLSRFMAKMNYKWDNHKKNYILIDKGAEIKRAPKSEKGEKAVTVEKAIDPLDLLERKEVLALLQQSDELLNLIDSQKIKDTKALTNNEKTTYSFWKKAQDFAFMRKASYTTSVRLPIELNARLNKFKEDSNLTQTQILCMALDYFMTRFESKITKI